MLLGRYSITVQGVPGWHQRPGMDYADTLDEAQAVTATWIDLGATDVKLYDPDGNLLTWIANEDETIIGEKRDTVVQAAVVLARYGPDDGIKYERALDDLDSAVKTLAAALP